MTLRELVWMAAGREQVLDLNLRAAWSQTSCVLAAIWTANRNLKKPRLFRPTEFDPFRRKHNRGIPITKANIHLLKALAQKGHQQ